MRFPRLRLGPLVLLGLFVVTWGGAPDPTRAEVASEARTPGEIYERKASLLDELLHVVGDLQVRAQADEVEDPAVLLLVLSPTGGLGDEIAVVAAAVPRLFGAVKAGLRLGIATPSGVRAEPTADAVALRGALVGLSKEPAPGLQDLHGAVRLAARAFPPGRGPRAILLLAEASADAEADVEATRDDLLNVGAAFYAIAPEAAFERAWLYPRRPRADPSRDLSERDRPTADRREAGALFYGSEVAYPLVPWSWEHRLAQLDFFWGKPPRYPVPSGYGAWSLATLAFATGGRYFIHDFQQPATRRAGRPRGRRKLLYEISRLNLLAPDLRPRSRVRRDLSKDPRARTILRIWEHLADEACPIIDVRGYLELTAGALAERSRRPVRSIHRPTVWYEEMDDVRKAIQYGERRLDRLELARRWWSQTNAKPREARAQPDPLAERLEADFQLLGLFLAQVRLQWLERRAALDSIKPLHVSYRRVRLVPRALVLERDKRGPTLDLRDRERNLALAELRLARNRIRKKYRGTPWALLVEKQAVHAFDLDVQVLDPEEEDEARRRRREAAQRRARGGEQAGSADPKPAPRAPAPARPGPRPGSTGGGPATGGD